MITAKTFTVAEGTKYQIDAVVTVCGPDMNVALLGGSGHHVGAVALGCNRPPKEGKERSASVSVICAFEHKDDIVAHLAAGYLATQLRCRVGVSAGVHIDHASVEELLTLKQNCQQVCEAIVAYYQKQK